MADVDCVGMHVISAALAACNLCPLRCTLCPACRPMPLGLSTHAQVVLVAHQLESASFSHCGQLRTLSLRCRRAWQAAAV